MARRVDILIAATLALTGIAMAPLPLIAVAGTFVAAVAFAFAMDFVKVPVFHCLAIG